MYFSFVLLTLEFRCIMIIRATNVVTALALRRLHCSKEHRLWGRSCCKPGAPSSRSGRSARGSQAVGSRSSFTPGQATLGPVAKVPSEGGARHALGPSPRIPAQLVRVSRLPERPRPPARRPHGGFLPTESFQCRPTSVACRVATWAHARCPTLALSVLAACRSPGEGLPRRHPSRSGEPATSV